MKTIRKTIDITAPVQSVYEFLTEPTNLPSIWPTLVSVSNISTGPAGAHDFDWVYKMAGLHFKGHSKTEEVSPGKFVLVRNEGGIPGVFRWFYEALDGAGTRLTLEVEYTIPARVIGKIAEALVAKINEREADTLLSNLKDVMEHRAATAATEAYLH